MPTIGCKFRRKRVGFHIRSVPNVLVEDWILHSTKRVLFIQKTLQFIYQTHVTEEVTEMKGSVFCVLILSCLITLSTGCSETEQPVAVGPDVPDDEVILTAARLESMVDAEIFLKAAGYAKVYVRLRDEDPDAAYVALERGCLFSLVGGIRFMKSGHS